MSSAVCPECGYQNEPDATFCEECGKIMNGDDADKPGSAGLFAHSIGDVIGKRYEIAAIVRQSASDSAYIATDNENEGKFVFLKHKRLDPDEIDRQEELYDVLVGVPHENIVKILDVIVREDCMYVVFEKLHGDNLQHLLANNRDELKEENVLSWAIQAAEGLRHLHAKLVLHLDIQPAHLFLTSEGKVKIIGLSRICKMGDTPDDNAVTEGFSPPEAYGLMGGRLGQRSDIFSLGASLYSLMSRRAPKLSRENFFSFPPLADICPDINEEFDKIIQRAVKKEPIARFDGVSEMLQALSDLKSKGLGTKKKKKKELQFEIVAKSHVGRVRKINQDSFLVTRLNAFEKSRANQFELLVVADGMGGEAEGDKASSLAVKVIVREVVNSFLPVTGAKKTTLLLNKDNIQEQTSEILTRAILKANKVVLDYSKEDKSRRGMGSTITAAIIMEDNLCVCHAGDTRGYVFNSNTGLEQITEDHSLVGRLVRLGQLTREEALNSPQRSAVYRALGTTPELDVDVYQHTLKPGDYVFLCSDGVWEYFPDKELSSIIIKEGRPGRIINKLIEICLDRGADDNATIIGLKVLDEHEVKAMNVRKDKTASLREGPGQVNAPPPSTEDKVNEDSNEDSDEDSDRGESKKDRSSLLAEKIEKVKDERKKAKHKKKGKGEAVPEVTPSEEKEEPEESEEPEITEVLSAPVEDSAGEASIESEEPAGDVPPETEGSDGSEEIESEADSDEDPDKDDNV